MYLDTIDNYSECMREHIVKDQVVTPGVIREAEKNLNNHSRSWVRICRMGDGNQHRWRINRALVSNYATIPPLTGLRKDHKPDLHGDPEIGPKLHPLCPANHAPSAPLSNLLAKVCKGVI